MTPQLQAALAAINLLSATERQQLLQMLNQDNLPLSPQSKLKQLSTQFWQGVTLQHLLTTQTPKTVHTFKAFTADFWPSDESIDDFLNFLQQQRQSVI